MEKIFWDQILSPWVLKLGGGIGWNCFIYVSKALKTTITVDVYLSLLQNLPKTQLWRALIQGNAEDLLDIVKREILLQDLNLLLLLLRL